MEKEDSSTVETPEVQNIEEEEVVEKDPGQVSSSEKEDLSFETISSNADSFHTSPESVPSYDSFDAESLPSSESLPDEYPGSNEARQPVNGKRKEKSRLSDRAEYLARPKKDFLDRVKFQRLDGALPEKPLPSWSVLPLPTKLPVGSYPYKITMTKLGDELYLPSTGVKMDLFDENNYQPAMKEYKSLHDPHLKAHFKKDKIRQHLKKDGFVSESGRVICSLKDINDYREYQRRIIAERIQQQYRDQIKEEKMEHEKKIKEKLDREEEKLRNARLQTNMRSYIKNAVSSIQEGSMESQRERDRKVLNKQIRLQLKWKQSALAKEERYKRIYQQHISEKYESEEKRRAIELEMARQDVEHLEEICRRRSEEALEKKKKLCEFWDRKVANQIEWVEKGFELEKKWSEDRKQKIATRKAKAMNLGTESESSTELASVQSEEFEEESEQSVEEEPVKEEKDDDEEETEDEQEESESDDFKSYVSETETETEQDIKEELSRINRSTQITTVAKSRLKEFGDHS